MGRQVVFLFKAEYCKCDSSRGRWGAEDPLTTASNQAANQFTTVMRGSGFPGGMNFEDVRPFNFGDNHGKDEGRGCRGIRGYHDVTKPPTPDRIPAS